VTIDTLELAKQLISRPSVTPDDAGCIDLLSEHLRPLGFDCEKISQGGVDNLWARRAEPAPDNTALSLPEARPSGDITREC
jgi:succinyl-diaminopimelate desuccinylase